jgi:UDP-N-acetylmuramoylalanine--D-glutamate ligase
MTKRIGIIGWGKSGRSAAFFLQSQNVVCDIYDDHKKEYGSFSCLDPSNLKKYDYLVVSPGIATTHPLITKAVHDQVPVRSEIDLGMESITNQMIGITGTNGKTTTCLLLQHILQSNGKKAKVLGNIGTPLTSYKPDEKEIIILELSSFQLLHTHIKKLSHGAIINITPNHLDVHVNYKEYVQAKLHIKDLVIEGGKLFTSKKIKKQFFASDSDVIAFRERKTFCSMLPLENRLAALHLASELGCDPSIAIKSLASFTMPCHRMEPLGVKKGIHWINDSKSTTPQATLHAVHLIRSPIVLIVGGKDKNCDFSIWKKQFPKQIKNIIVMGFSAKKIKEQIESSFEVTMAKNLEEACCKALQKAGQGDSVLLSPGCTSFDEFKNFEQRGDAFKAWIEKMGDA